MTEREEPGTTRHSAHATSELSSAANDVGDYAQLFASALTVVLLIVSATSARELIFVAGTLLATAALCNLVVFLFRHRSRLHSIKGRAAIMAVVAIMSIVAAFVLRPAAIAVGSAQPSSAADGQGATSEHRRLLLSKRSYLLEPSPPANNDRDKVDLDTGCPGWGPMRPHVGPPRCGENADLIVESDSIHASEDEQQMIVMQGAAGADECFAALAATPDRRVGRVGLNSLHVGSVLCVRTDKDNLAAVTIDHIAEDGSTTISFDVWDSSGQ